MRGNMGQVPCGGQVQHTSSVQVRSGKAGVFHCDSHLLTCWNLPTRLPINVPKITTLIMILIAVIAMVSPITDACSSLLVPLGQGTQNQSMILKCGIEGTGTCHIGLCWLTGLGQPCLRKKSLNYCYSSNVNMFPTGSSVLALGTWLLVLFQEAAEPFGPRSGRQTSVCKPGAITEGHSLSCCRHISVFWHAEK